MLPKTPLRRNSTSSPNKHAHLRRINQASKLSAFCSLQTRFPHTSNVNFLRDNSSHCFLGFDSTISLHICKWIGLRAHLCVPVSLTSSSFPTVPMNSSHKISAMGASRNEEEKYINHLRVVSLQNQLC